MELPTLDSFLTAAVTAFVTASGVLAFLPQRLADAFFGDLVARRLETLRAENASLLEAVKAENASALEAAKHELQWLADRGTRSNEREYQAIADAWEAFLDADINTRAAVISSNRFPTSQTWMNQGLLTSLTNLMFTILTNLQFTKHRPTNATIFLASIFKVEPLAMLPAVSGKRSL